MVPRSGSRYAYNRSIKQPFVAVSVADFGPRNVQYNIMWKIEKPISAWKENYLARFRDIF